jgi:hypothetical protein
MKTRGTEFASFISYGLLKRSYSGCRAKEATGCRARVTVNKQSGNRKNRLQVVRNRKISINKSPGLYLDTDFALGGKKNEKR